MHKMILASGNAHKLEEIQAILKDFAIDLTSMADAGLKNFEIIEDGDTFEANAMIKAKAVMDKLGVDAIADDSGIEVGRPLLNDQRKAGVIEPVPDDIHAVVTSGMTGHAKAVCENLFII